MKRKRYFFQPELSLAIIYWSITFFILFLSLILTLEKTHPYLKSNMIMIIFFGLVLFGLYRFFTLSTEGIWEHPFLFRKKLFTKKDLKKVSVVKLGICLQLTSGKNKLYVMTKKQKTRFLADLKEILPEIIIETK